MEYSRECGPGIRPCWIVKDVIARDDRTLILTFEDGRKGLFDAWDLHNEGPAFAPLSDLKLFMNAYVDGGSVAWSDEIDIAPEYLYQHAEEII